MFLQIACACFAVIAEPMPSIAEDMVMYGRSPQTAPFCKPSALTSVPPFGLSFGWSAFIVSATRTEAENLLMRVASEQEKFFTTFNRYSSSISAARNDDPTTSGLLLKVSQANTQRHRDDDHTWGDTVWAHWSPSAHVVLTR